MKVILTSVSKNFKNLNLRSYAESNCKQNAHNLKSKTPSDKKSWPENCYISI